MSVQLAHPTTAAELVLRIDGRFDFRMNQEFRNAYETVAPGVRTIVVDLSRVDSIDSSALGMLLMMRDKAGGGRTIRLVGARATVKRILEIAKFDALFVVE